MSTFFRWRQTDLGGAGRGNSDRGTVEAGVSKDTISRIERTGRAYPSTIRKLADALEVDPAELVKGEE